MTTAFRFPAGTLALARRPTLAEVFDSHAAFVMRFVRRLGVPDSEVDDVTQEVFMVVHRKLGDFDPKRSMRSWLVGISRRVTMRHLDKAYRRREKSSEAQAEAAVAPTQLTELQAQDRRKMLDRALDTLDADKRVVFVLYELEEQPMNEIAEALGCPVQTAYARLYAARKKMRAFIQDQLAEEER